MRDYDYDEDGPYVVIEKRSGGFGSFVTGLAIGAAIAILFAPASGEETRRRLSRGARRARRAAESAVGEVTEKVGETFANAKQRVEEKIDEARGAIEVKREQVHRAMQAGREAAQQAREDLERRLAETKAAYQAGAQVARESSRLSADRARQAAVREAKAESGKTRDT